MSCHLVLNTFVEEQQHYWNRDMAVKAFPRAVDSAACSTSFLPYEWYSSVYSKAVEELAYGHSGNTDRFPNGADLKGDLIQATFWKVSESC